MTEPHPWFDPLYRRVLTLAVCLGWLLYELTQGEVLWLTLAAASSVYALFEFFLLDKYPTSRRPGNGH